MFTFHKGSSKMSFALTRFFGCFCFKNSKLEPKIYGIHFLWTDCLCVSHIYLPFRSQRTGQKEQRTLPARHLVNS